ncbi:hypothetical protein [Psychrobacter sp.]|uniref:hypothetical protein n=1 Tax=Psychrobacter sp. TaxID=56811 RepID=UPI0025F21012|nr:hypothetical protein [Psychrobacter sp.]
MKKFKLLATTVLSSLLMFSAINVNAKEINENSLSSQIKNDRFHTRIIPLQAEDTVNLSSSYNATIITSPETGQRFLKVPAQVSEYGLKKAAIVIAFRYGGPNLALVLDTVSPAVGTYIKNNSLKIATTIDGVSYMAEGSIMQALISAGIPSTTARTITWAITTVLL